MALAGSNVQFRGGIWTIKWHNTMSCPMFFCVVIVSSPLFKKGPDALFDAADGTPTIASSSIKEPAKQGKAAQATFGSDTGRRHSRLARGIREQSALRRFLSGLAGRLLVFGSSLLPERGLACRSIVAVGSTDLLLKKNNQQVQ